MGVALPDLPDESDEFDRFYADLVEPITVPWAKHEITEGVATVFYGVWCAWMHRFMGQCIMREDGVLMIAPDQVSDLLKQICSSYADLKEEDKEIFRDSVVRGFIAQGTNRAAVE